MPFAPPAAPRLGARRGGREGGTVGGDGGRLGARQGGKQAAHAVICSAGIFLDPLLENGRFGCMTLVSCVTQMEEWVSDLGEGCWRQSNAAAVTRCRRAFVIGTASLTCLVQMATVCVFCYIVL